MECFLARAFVHAGLVKRQIGDSKLAVVCPWEREHTERELARELTRGHPLFGVAVRALARRQDCDDVLFALDGQTMVLLHGFIKKQQATPKPDLDLARDRLKQLRRR